MKKAIVGLALMLAALCLGGCQEEEAPAPELMEPVGVQSDMATAYVGEIFRLEYTDASVVPYVEELCFEVDGRVSRLLVYPGMEVKEGDVLIELDQEAEEKRAAQLRREIEYLEADYACDDALAELDIDMALVRVRQLKSGGASVEEVALAEMDVEEMRASLRHTQQLRQPELEARRRELEGIEKTLEKNCLRAPFSGRIMYGTYLTEYSWVQAYTPVLYLADDARLHLRSNYISESAFQSAHRVYARIGSVDYDIELRPVSQSEYIAAVLAGKTPKSEFDVVGPDDHLSKLEAGQYAAICQVRGYVGDALLVPSGAVLRDATGRYVYVDENGERVRRMVRVGVSTDAMTQILEGLEEGDVVYVKD